MSEQRQLLGDTVQRLFRDLMVNWRDPVTPNNLPMHAWQAIEDMELTSLLQPEAAGGYGGTWVDALVVFNAIGFHAVPLPIGETLIARHLLVKHQLPVPGGAISLGVSRDAELRVDSGTGLWTLSGSVADVPWGLAAQSLLVACLREDSEYLVLLSTDSARTKRTALNAANEPRATLHFLNAPIAAIHHGEEAETNGVMQLGALLRASQAAGAMHAILEQSVEYVVERKQFGRALGKFQAIQHQLAQLAEETAAVRCAVSSAGLMADAGHAGFEIAAAKLRASQATALAVSIAHQVHGAIGFTQEYPLHTRTCRLLAWRQEYGNERYWGQFLGRYVLRQKVPLWRQLTERGDRLQPLDDVE